ncbi:MAG: AsmA family protein, partial [Saprospiraceae bacterium]|nr:AsmA family protein [Saprospiraceae bacterium]
MSFKKIILGIIIFILLIVSTLLVLPFFFKDKILQVAKSEINKNIDARVDFKDVDISFFKSFPLLRADLQDVSVVGVKEFDSIPLLSAKSLGVALEVMPLLKSMSNINIKGIYAESPTVNILVRSDGKANYDITKPDTTTSEPASEFKINLEKYKISNANITYKDNSSKNEVIVKGLNHKGSGEFSSTVYDLDTKTNIDSLSYFSGNMKYLSKAKVDLDAIFNIDMALSKYSLKQNKLKINDLEINADGFVQMIGSIIAMDLKLKSPQTDFKSLFSIIPGAYTSDYSNVKSSGSFDFKADIKGKYDGAKGRYPSFAINSLIKDGFIQYPS